MQEPIVKRFKGNPILTKKDVPYAVHTVHNAGVAKHQGTYYMLFRSHLDTGRSIIGLAESDDGYSFKVHDKPFMTPATEGIFKAYEAFGVEALSLGSNENWAWSNSYQDRKRLAFYLPRCFSHHGWSNIQVRSSLA